MNRIVLSSLFVVLMATVPGIADPAGTKPPSTPAVAAGPAVAAPAGTAENDADTIVCKWTPIVGSRFAERLCLSKRRWLQMHQDGQDFMRNLDERSSTQEGG